MIEPLVFLIPLWTLVSAQSAFHDFLRQFASLDDPPLPLHSRTVRPTPSYMFDLQAQRLGHGYADANTVRHFAIVSEMDGMLTFNITLPDIEEFLGADLVLPHYLTRDVERRNDVNATAQDVTANVTRTHTVRGSLTRLRRKLPDDRRDPVTLDVSDSISHWLSGERPAVSSQQLHVRALTEGDPMRTRRKRRSVHDEPALLLYTFDKSMGKRRKRTAEQTAEQSDSRRRRRRGRRRRLRARQCKRRRMYVNFEKIGWGDWIMAPRGYQAHVCDGPCRFPFAQHMNATNHAIMQSIMNSVSPTLAPQPCCVPTELSPISLLYNSARGVMTKLFEDMVVEACGCR